MGNAIGSSGGIFKCEVKARVGAGVTHVTGLGSGGPLDCMYIAPSRLSLLSRLLLQVS